MSVDMHVGRRLIWGCGHHSDSPSTPERPNCVYCGQDAYLIIYNCTLTYVGYNIPPMKVLFPTKAYELKPLNFKIGTYTDDANVVSDLLITYDPSKKEDPAIIIEFKDGIVNLQKNN